MSELFYKDHSHILLPKDKFIFHFLLRLRGLIENDERHEQWPTRLLNKIFNDDRYSEYQKDPPRLVTPAVTSSIPVWQLPPLIAL